MTKAQKQKLMLGILAVATFGVLGYAFRATLLPVPSYVEGTLTPAPVRLPTIRKDDPLYTRADFRDLKTFAPLPVRALPAPRGTPFEPPPERE